MGGIVFSALPPIFFLRYSIMKKDMFNKKNQDEIVLDEETKNDVKKKPTAKKIFFAVVLIILAVIFAILGFCVVGGAFDNRPKCNVALADTVPQVNNLSEQASSNYSLEDISSYSKLFGVFINKSFKPTYAQCVEKDSFFGSFMDSTLSIDIQSTASDGFYSRYFNFAPSKLSNDVLSELGATFTLTSPVYALRCITAKNSDDMGSGFCYLIYNDIADYNNLINWELAPVLLFNSHVVTMFDLESIPKSDNTSVTYTPFVPSVTGMTSEMLSYWADFIYLSLSSIGGISQSDYDKVVSERDNATSAFNDYKTTISNQFSFVPEVFTSPTSSERLNRFFITSSTKLDVFVVDSNKSISDIIDVNGNLILPVEGITPNVDVSGVWQLLLPSVSFQGFVTICDVANLTPSKQGISPKGIICSYDSSNKKLTVFRDVVSFANSDLETSYKSLGASYQEFGTSIAQADRTATTEGIISVLESPVNFLKTVFNFEIFGINLSAVVFFVLSIIIVAFVIKKVV